MSATLVARNARVCSAAVRFRDEMQGVMSDKSTALRAKNDAEDRAENGQPSGSWAARARWPRCSSVTELQLCSLLTPCHRTRGAHDGTAYPGVTGH